MSASRLMRVVDCALILIRVGMRHITVKSRSDAGKLADRAAESDRRVHDYRTWEEITEIISKVNKRG